MILNKSSYERGFAHGCIFKSMFIELESVSTILQVQNLLYAGLEITLAEKEHHLDSRVYQLKNGQIWRYLGVKKIVSSLSFLG